MDYEKIYYDFIQDRKEKSANLPIGTYTEGHHIIPRALGGSNSKSNIVNLIPEDHFFAHILLAKIHGGKMMRALFAMSNLRKGCEQRPDFSKRMRYGYIRRLVAREYSENYSGINSPAHDPKNYTLHNHDGSSISGTRILISKMTGLKSEQISALIVGGKYNIKGWYYRGTNPGLTRKELLRKNSKKVCRKIYNLYHFDGREWSGTRLEFQDKFKMRLHFQSKKGNCDGWYRDKHGAEGHFQRLKDWRNANSKKRGDISGKNNPRADDTVYDWINFKTLERKKATRVEMMGMLGIKSNKLHAVFVRKQKTVRDWGFYEVYLIRDEIKIYRKDRHGEDDSRSRK